MFASLLAAGGVYLYARYTDNQLDLAIEALNSEIGGFSQADMERVTEFDLRLAQAQDRLGNSVSMVSVFEALQAATIDTVQISSLAIEREDDNQLLLAADIQTDSFDSTIFQRGVFLRDGTIQKVEISDVNNTLVASGGRGAQSLNLKPAVSFQASLSIPLEDVPANPQSYQSNQAVLVNSTPSTSTSAVGQDDQQAEVNEDTL